MPKLGKARQGKDERQRQGKVKTRDKGKARQGKKEHGNRDSGSQDNFKLPFG